MIAGRTGAPAATKRTSAFAHAVVVWLRRKMRLERLTVTRGKLTRVRNLVLYGMGARLGCARARTVLYGWGNVQKRCAEGVRGRGEAGGGVRMSSRASDAHRDPEQAALERNAGGVSA